MQLSHYQSIYNSELNHWWYVVRRKFIHDLIKKYISKQKNISILDVGCGAGALIKELEIYGIVNGVDFSKTAISFCKSRGLTNVQVSGIEKLPFKNNEFDVVLALDVLEHVSNDKDGVKEIFRVLKPGGIVIVFVPAYMFLWGVTDIVSHHYRRYTLKKLVSLFDNQFEILKMTYFNSFLFLPISIVRLITRFFGLKIEDENSIGNELINKILYLIFNFERFILRFISFPFGVSCCVVAKKKLD